MLRGGYSGCISRVHSYARRTPFPEALLSSSTLSRADHPDIPNPAPAPATVPARFDADWRLVLFGVLLISGVYVWSHLGGWDMQMPI